MSISKNQTNAQPALTVKQIAKLFNVSHVLISQARKIRREAPEMGPEIEAGNLTVSKAIAILKQKEAEKAAQSVFEQVVFDSSTDKTFRQKISELSVLINHCDISKSLAEFIDVSASIYSFENTLDVLKKLPKRVGVKKFEKELAQLKSEQRALQTNINDVIAFGTKSYSQWMESLAQEAHTDEEKELLKSMEEQFNEAWKQVKDEVQASKEDCCAVYVSRFKSVTVMELLGEEGRELFGEFIEWK